MVRCTNYVPKAALACQRIKRIRWINVASAGCPQITLAIARATGPMLRSFSAATQMRPESTP